MIRSIIMKMNQVNTQTLNRKLGKRESFHLQWTEISSFLFLKELLTDLWRLPDGAEMTRKNG